MGDMPFSTCPPYVSQPPREMADTCNPERPKNRYSILGMSDGFSAAIVAGIQGVSISLQSYVEFQKLNFPDWLLCEVERMIN